MTYVSVQLMPTFSLKTAVWKMHNCIYQLTIFKNLSNHQYSIVMQCNLNSVETATMQFNIEHNLHQSRKSFPKFIIRNLFHAPCSTPVTQQQYTTDKVDNYQDQTSTTYSYIILSWQSDSMCDVCNVILSAALSVKMLHNSDGQALGPANYKKKLFI